MSDHRFLCDVLTASAENYAQTGDISSAKVLRDAAAAIRKLTGENERLKEVALKDADAACAAYRLKIKAQEELTELKGQWERMLANYASAEARAAKLEAHIREIEKDAPMSELRLDFTRDAQAELENCRAYQQVLEAKIARLEEELRTYKHRCLEAVRLNDEANAKIEGLKQEKRKCRQP